MMLAEGDDFRSGPERGGMNRMIRPLKSRLEREGVQSEAYRGGVLSTWRMFNIVLS